VEASASSIYWYRPRDRPLRDRARACRLHRLLVRWSKVPHERFALSLKRPPRRRPAPVPSDHRRV